GHSIEMSDSSVMDLALARAWSCTLCFGAAAIAQSYTLSLHDALPIFESGTLQLYASGASTGTFGTSGGGVLELSGGGQDLTAAKVGRAVVWNPVTGSAGTGSAASSTTLSAGTFTVAAGAIIGALTQSG